MNQTDPLSNLADIELPAPPDWWPVIIAAIAAVLVIIVLGLIIWRIMKGKNSRRDSSLLAIENGRKLLDQLEDNWRHGKVNDREASFQLSTLLRLGLGLPQLTPRCPAGLKEDENQWGQTIRIFDQLRYTKTSTARLTPDVFGNIKKWLASAVGNHQ